MRLGMIFVAALLHISAFAPASQFWDVTPAALRNANFRTTDKVSVEYSMKNFDYLGVVFVGRDSTGNMMPMYWVKLGSLCVDSPANFYDLDANKQGCP